ncbi:hypothetical protein C7475_107286 [Chitinophaga sp. S165]|nr:hypothetical protein C7475_107286 [Chitinophaga sp. S165]
MVSRTNCLIPLPLIFLPYQSRLFTNIFLTVFVKDLLKKRPTKLIKPSVDKESGFQAQILIYLSQANNLTPLHQNR